MMGVVDTFGQTFSVPLVCRGVQRITLTQLAVTLLKRLAKNFY